MRKYFLAFTLIYFLASASVSAESFRILLSEIVDVSSDNPGGVTVNLPYNGSVLIQMGDARFIRGVELEFSAPQAWLRHRSTLAMVVYSGLNRIPALGVNDLTATRIGFMPLPGRIRTVYQIPIRAGHGLRPGPYATVQAGITHPSSFPLIFRLMPVEKGVSSELENMRFTLRVRPILSDEGAVRFIPRFPPQLPDRPFIVLVDDVVVGNITEELVLREGERSLVVLSEDYRNISRRFIVERGRVRDIVIDLQDPTPLLVFEGPENALIFLNGNPVVRDGNPVPVDPGVHEVRFTVGDYTIIRTTVVERGKTYNISLSVGININEID